MDYDWMAKKLASMQIGKASFLSLAVTSVLYSGSASAQLTQNITLGNPKALALGHAVTADPPGIDSIHFNPAGLAKITGRQQQFKVLAAHITYEAELGDRHLDKSTISEDGGVLDTYEDLYGEYPDDPAENKSSATSDPMVMLPGVGLTSVPFLVVPFGGIAVEDPNYGWTFATAVYSPQAIGYERAEDDPATFQGQQLGISRITYFSPSVAFHFNDTLMVGASIGFSWQGFGIKTNFRAPEATVGFIAGGIAQLESDLGMAEGTFPLHSISPYDKVGTLEIELEDALSLSFNIGALWEPTEWLSFGFVYHSEATADLEGDFQMSYTDEWLSMTSGLAPFNPILGLINDGGAFNAQEVEKGNIKSEYIVPAHMAFGTSIKVLPDLKVNFDVKWTDYDSWEYLTFTFSQNVDFLSLSNLVYNISSIAAEDGDNADPNVMRIKRDYESTWSWAIGFEYQYSDNLVLRAGYEPRESAVPDNRVDLLAPLAYADLYTFGFGYQIDAYSHVDFGFGYMHTGFDAEAGESENMNSVQPGRVVYNPYAFLDVKAETNAYIFALSYDKKF